MARGSRTNLQRKVLIIDLTLINERFLKKTKFQWCEKKVHAYDSGYKNVSKELLIFRH